MSESNNVKFVEANGKWLWKRYDEQGSVIFKSPEFNTEREAREDYEVNGDKPVSSSENEVNVDPTSPQQAPEGTTEGSEGDLNAGSAGSAENQGSEQIS